MIEFGDVIYYIDMEALDKAINLNNPSMDKIIEQETKIVTNEDGNVIGSEIVETVRERGKEIDGAKYDILRMMIEVLIDYNEEIDDSLGADRALNKTPLSYKLAFNTLKECGILREKEDKE